MSPSSAFERAVRALAQSARDGRPAPPGAFDRVHGTLISFVRSRAGVRVHDAEDAAAEAIERLVVAARDGRLDLDDRPGSYLLTVARRVAVDQWRRHGAREELTDQPPEQATDDEVIRMLDADATGARIQAALRRAYEEDVAMSLVIRTWLDMAWESGSEPSTRAVGERAGVSHSTVVRALARFREYLR